MLAVLLLFSVLFSGINAGPTNFITGSQPADFSRFTYQAQVQQGVYFNGATILAKRHVLTAASIMRNMIDHTTVIVGSKRLGGYKDKRAQKRQVSKIIIHPKFQAYNKTNDIAILVLKRDLDLNDVAQPATLPPQGLTVPEGKEGFISGWGNNGSGYSILNLTFAKTTTFNTVKCKQIFITQPVTDEMFCAKADKVTFCFGDYGGPYVIDNILQGIMSWGGPCSVNAFPGVCTRISAYSDWIQDEMSKSQGNEND